MRIEASTRSRAQDCGGATKQLMFCLLDGERERAEFTTRMSIMAGRRASQPSQTRTRISCHRRRANYSLVELRVAHHPKRFAPYRDAPISLHTPTYNVACNNTHTTHFTKPENDGTPNDLLLPVTFMCVSVSPSSFVASVEFTPADNHHILRRRASVSNRVSGSWTERLQHRLGVLHLQRRCASSKITLSVL